MDVFAINTIQETVHLVSMFSYMNTLSEFLFSGSFITEQDKFDLIPVTNGIYRYLESFADTPDRIQNPKTILIKEIINGSDIYGGKPDENPDPLFVNELFKRIITSTVFNNNFNIFGFIVDTIRNSSTFDVGDIIYQLRNRMNSSLSSIAAKRAFNDYVLPMFPLPDDESVNLTSVEFLYAQAGAMFVLSGSAHAEFDQIFLYNKSGSKFQEYSLLAHGIEHLINSGQMDESISRIFNLPALLYYVAKERDNLVNETTGNIVTNPDHLTKALELLFNHVNKTITEAKIAQENDAKYQFLSTVSKYQNRTEMARNLINDRCLMPNGTNLHVEIEKYKNNPGGYVCDPKNRNSTAQDTENQNKDQNTQKEKMPNLNELFYKQNRNISEKCFLYEKEAIPELFGEEFIKSVDNDEVEISKGFYKGYYVSEGLFDAEDVQKLRNSDDLLKFHYLRTGKVEYYGLTRTDNIVTLIREANNIHFREQLGLEKDQYFRDRNFNPIKEVGENFTVMVQKLSEARKKMLNNALDTNGYEETRREWWIEFGLNLIPFYSCYKAIKAGDAETGSAMCTMDGFLIFNMFAEVLEDLLMHTTNALLARNEIKLSTLIFRNSLTQTVERGVLDIASIFRQMIKKTALSTVRLIDPGCELIFSLSTTSFLSLRSLITKFEKEYFLKFPIVNNLLDKFANLELLGYAKKNTMYDRDVYYRTTGDKGFGYGYKFVEQPGNSYPYAQVRWVAELDEEIPVVLTGVRNGEKIYNEVNLYTGRVKKEYHLQNRFPFERSENAETRIWANREYNTGTCLISKRRKRSPMFYCSRTMSFLEKKDRQLRAMNIAKTIKFPLPANIESELDSYVFTFKYDEINFMLDWIKYRKVPPNWQMMKLQNPYEFEALMYHEVLDNPELTEWVANDIIANNYAHEDRIMIELFKPVNKVHEEFIQSRGYELMSFLDFYSVEHFLHRGLRRINFNTNEAILMRQALYRLAVRQKNFLPKKVSETLFTTEVKTWEEFEKAFVENEEYVLPNFTPTTREMIPAMKRTDVMSEGYVKVLYQFKMQEQYLSARVNKVLQNDIEENILLPGTQFKIENINNYVLGQEEVKLVELSLVQKNSIEMNVKQIMDELHNLENQRQPLFHLMNM